MNKSKQTLRLPIRATVMVAILTVWSPGSYTTVISAWIVKNTEKAENFANF